MCNAVIRKIEHGCNSVRVASCRGDGMGKWQRTVWLTPTVDRTSTSMTEKERERKTVHKRPPYPRGVCATRHVMCEKTCSAAQPRDRVRRGDTTIGNMVASIMQPIHNGVCVCVSVSGGSLRKGRSCSNDRSEWRGQPTDCHNPRGQLRVDGKRGPPGYRDRGSIDVGQSRASSLACCEHVLCVRSRPHIRRSRPTVAAVRR